MTESTSPAIVDERPCLEFRDVWYQYDSQPVIESITFTVARGEFMAILGPNGSGKTTLLKLALGLVRPTSGTVLLFGQPASQLRARGRMGYVPQSVDGMNNQFPATVEEVVVYGLYGGFDPLAIWRRKSDAATRALEAVGMADLASRRISSLSVGQQQRTLIARALVREPEFLVLDEPVAGVDAAGQEQLYAMLRRLHRERGITVLMVTHDIGVVMRQAETVACVNRTLVFHGPPHRITQKEISDLYGLPMDLLMHDTLHEHR